MVPRLLLFDIDGTLVVSRHKKFGNDYGSYLLEGLSIAFKQEIKRNGVIFSGKAISKLYFFNSKQYFIHYSKTLFSALEHKVPCNTIEFFIVAILQFHS